MKGAFLFADLLFSLILCLSWTGKQLQEITAPKHHFQGRQKHDLNDTELLSPLFI